MMAAFGGYYLPFVGGFIGAIATATADTLASEIGILQQPRLITTFQKVDPGTDGAEKHEGRDLYDRRRRRSARREHRRGSGCLRGSHAQEGDGVTKNCAGDRSLTG